MSIRPHPTKHKRYPGETWWQIDIGRGDNRQRISFEGSYAAAEEFEADQVQQMAGRATGRTLSGAPKLKEMFTPFLKDYAKEVAASTVEDMTDSINIYFVAWFGNLKPGQLTRKHFEDFRDALLEKDLKPATINKHLNYFSSIMRWVVRNGYGKPLSFELPRFNKKKTKAKKKVPLTAKQVTALLKAIEPHYRLAFLLMADAGLRQEEALTMKVENIDEDSGTIHVTGKGNKDRVVPIMTDRLESALKDAIGDRVSGYLVVNQATKKPYATIWKALKRAAIKVELGRDDLNHHLLRKTFSTQAARDGISPYALQQIMGHEDISTTMKIYTNIGADLVGREAQRIRDQRNF